MDRREGKRKGREGREEDWKEMKRGKRRKGSASGFHVGTSFFPLQALNGTSANTRFTGTVIDRHGCDVHCVIEK